MMCLLSPKVNTFISKKLNPTVQSELKSPNKKIPETIPPNESKETEKETNDNNKK